MLKLDEVSKEFRAPEGSVRAVDGVSLEIKSGDLAAVHGPSGCGKTTLLLMAGALLRPTEGQVQVDGVDVYTSSSGQRAEMRADRIGFVFQRFHLVPYLSVLENIMVPSLSRDGQDVRDRAEELIRDLNLEHRRLHEPSALSTGERQRTVIARALLNQPRLLLADEPTGNLDERNAEVVLTAMADFAEAGGAVLVVSHDPRATRYADQRFGMEQGRLQEEVEMQGAP